jgi:hypothetical protein
VNSHIGICAVLTLSFLAPSCLAQNVPATKAVKTDVQVSVYDDATVPPGILAAAEVQVRRIFQHAGVEILWLNCFKRAEIVLPAGCHVIGSNHLVLKILPHAIGAQVRDRNDVLGTATLDEQGVGYYGYAFYDRIQQMAEARRLASALLGHVFAHEIGHLLLQSNSHSISGIMSGRWAGGELRRISEGTMFFMPKESKIMQERLSAFVRKSADLPQPIGVEALSFRGIENRD